MTPRLVFVFLITILSVGLLGPAPVAMAQCDFQMEAERARILIDRATEVVHRVDLAEAGEILRAARVRLKEAFDLAQRDQRDLACRLVRASQSLAQKAIEVATRNVRILEELEHRLQRTDELLRDSASMVEESGSPEARRFLSGAMEQQKKAWSAFRHRRPRLAIKLTGMARDAAQRAVRFAEGGGGDRLRRVDREIARTDRFLDEAKDRVLDGNGRNALERAQEVQARAKRQLHQGHPGIALGLTRQARILIRRALGRGDTQPKVADVKAMIETTSALVDRLQEVATEGGHDRAFRFLQRAERLLDEAQTALEKGQIRQAVVAVRSASALALDVSEMLERGDGE